MNKKSIIKEPKEGPTVVSHLSQEILDKWAWKAIQGLVAQSGVFCYTGTAYLRQSLSREPQ
jgi:hypothetical protein